VNKGGTRLQTRLLAALGQKVPVAALGTPDLTFSGALPETLGGGFAGFKLGTCHFRPLCPQKMGLLITLRQAVFSQR
jgi:hypothetical protein